MTPTFNIEDKKETNVRKQSLENNPKSKSEIESKNTAIKQKKKRLDNHARKSICVHSMPLIIEIKD